MSSESKKAAPEATSGESVQTETAEAQEQPTTTPDGSTAGSDPAVRSKNPRRKPTFTSRAPVSLKKLNEEEITCPTCARYGERVEFNTLEELTKHIAIHPDPVRLARIARDARKILNASQLNGKSPVTDVEKYQFVINCVKSQTRFNDSAAGVFVSLVRLSNDNLYVANVWLQEIDDVAAKALFNKAQLNHARFLTTGNLDPIEQDSLYDAVKVGLKEHLKDKCHNCHEPLGADRVLIQEGTDPGEYCSDCAATNLTAQLGVPQHAAALANTLKLTGKALAKNPVKTPANPPASPDTITCGLCKQTFKVNRKTFNAPESQAYINHMREHFPSMEVPNA